MVMKFSKAIQQEIDKYQLVAYGFQDERVDYRAHVSFVTRRIYLYKFDEVVKLIESNSFRVAKAYQYVDSVAVVTALGFLVPLKIFKSAIAYAVKPEWVWEQYNADKASEYDKGRMAYEIVEIAVKWGIITLPQQVEEIKTLDEQVNGIDMVVFSKHTIQVKCDYNAGYKHLGGTGNLYIQFAELNPHKIR